MLTALQNPFLHVVRVLVFVDKTKALTGEGDLNLISRSHQQAINWQLEKALCQLAVPTSSSTALCGGAQVWKGQTDRSTPTKMSSRTHSGKTRNKLKLQAHLSVTPTVVCLQIIYLKNAETVWKLLHKAWQCVFLLLVGNELQEMSCIMNGPSVKCECWDI